MLCCIGHTGKIKVVAIVARTSVTSANTAETRHVVDHYIDVHPEEFNKISQSTEFDGQNTFKLISSIKEYRDKSYQ